MPSAIAQSNIFPGAAVTQAGAIASLAGPNTLASHVVTNGATLSGIVSMVAAGVVDLRDWTLSTGSKTLKSGATYFVGPGGTLSLSGNQPVGIATSPYTLSVTIQNNSENGSIQVSQSLAPINAALFNLQSQLTSLQVFTVALSNQIAALGNLIAAAIASSQASFSTVNQQISSIQTELGNQQQYIVLIAQAMQDNDLEIPSELEDLI